MSLTRKQRAILDFVREFSERRGYAPTLAEIGNRFRLRSPATVHKHLRNLEERGHIRRRSNRSRAIEVLPEPGRSQAWELPLLGEIESGKPVTWCNPDQAVPVPQGLVGQGPTFALRVRGWGLGEELLRDGDLLIVEETETLEEGALGLLVLGGGEVVLRAFSRDGDTLTLLPPVPGGARRSIGPGELRVKGRVLGLLRRY